MPTRRPLGIASTSRRRRSPPFFRRGPGPLRTIPRPPRCLRPRCPPEAIRRVAPQSAPRAASAIEAVTTGRSGVPATVAVRHVRAGSEKAQVGRVDRRGFHAHQHFIGAGSRNGNLVQRKFKRAIRAHQRTQLQCFAGQICGHGRCLVPVVGLPLRVSTLKAATDLPWRRGKTIGRRGARSDCAHAGCRRGPRTRTAP